jgi:hypothetical protein
MAVGTGLPLALAALRPLGGAAAEGGRLVGGVGEQRELAGALDRARDLALVAAAGAGDAARADLAALGDEPAQGADVLVVDLVDLVAAVRAGLAPGGPGAALILAPARAWLALLGHEPGPFSGGSRPPRPRRRAPAGPKASAISS